MPVPPQSLEVGDVLRQALDVVVGQRAGDARHVAGVVGAALGLEIGELLPDVLGTLPGDLRDLVLADEAARGGTSGTARRRRSCAPAATRAPSALNLIGSGFCAAKKLPSAIMSSRDRSAAIGDITGSRAPAFLEILELDVDIPPRLPGEDRDTADSPSSRSGRGKRRRPAPSPARYRFARRRSGRTRSERDDRGNSHDDGDGESGHDSPSAARRERTCGSPGQSTGQKRPPRDGRSGRGTDMRYCTRATAARTRRRCCRAWRRSGCSRRRRRPRTACRPPCRTRPAH